MNFFQTAMHTEGFSWQAALSLASASKLSYSPPETIAKVVTDDWGLEVSTIFEVGATQGYVCTSDTALVVAFRGTQSVADWIDNIQINSTVREYGAIHRGFFEAYERAASDVIDLVLAAATQRKSIWITGHSLGGALALTMALELPSEIALNGIYTFGQPRMLGRAARKAVKERFAGNYSRFVNNTDFVTRVPFNFGHSGGLVFFDANGNVETASAVESDSGSTAEMPPVTEAEFIAAKELIGSIKTELATAEMLGEGADPRSHNEVLDASAEGFIPGLRDHRIDNYISLIRRYSGVSTTDSVAEVESLRSARSGRRTVVTRNFDQIVVNRKLDISARGVDRTDEIGAETESQEGFEFESLESVQAPPEAVAIAEERYPLLLRLRQVNWSPPTNVAVNSRIGNFATVLASHADLAALQSDPNVISIEASRDAGVVELENSTSFVGAKAVHRPPIDERGDMAIVGIIDTGVDILHESFLDKAGKTRIMALWNQRDNTGPSPRQVDPAAFTQDYGTLYTATDIDALITSSNVGGDPPPVLLRDPNGHGTHVASIATGRAVGPLPDGIAPEARLVVIIANMKTTPGDPPSLGYSISHLDGLAFIKTLAAGGNSVLTEGLPVAINASLGMNAGAHDGRTGLEAGFDAITGNGRDPGCVIVKSAGNERGHGGHACITGAFGVVELKWQSESLDRMQDYFEAWFNNLDDFAFALIDPAGNRSNSVSFDTPVENAVLGGNACALRLTNNHHDNGDNRLTITIRPLTGRIQDGIWTLETLARKIRSPDAAVHIWVERTDDRAVSFNVENENMTLSIPGTANTVVTVGACNSELPPRLNTSSSYGPTRDGRNKPEISAPGFRIVAAGSNQPDRQAAATKSGTSMAAPHVTGALALVMSHRHKQTGTPQFNAAQLLAAVKLAVKQFSHVPHPGFGHGVLDIEKLFEELNL